MVDHNPARKGLPGSYGIGRDLGRLLPPIRHRWGALGETELGLEKRCGVVVATET